MRCRAAAAAPACVLAAAIAAWSSVATPRLLELPAHMLAETEVFYESDLLSREVAATLRHLVKDLGGDESGFPTNVQDVKQSAAFAGMTPVEHIGEASPLPEAGCADPLFVPNANRSLCVLPGRIDVGRHYMLTGGLDGLREPIESLASRVQSFGRLPLPFPLPLVLTPRLSCLRASVG